MDWPVDRFEFAAGPADAGPGFEVANPRGSAEALLICDHASRLIPRDLNALGLGCGLLEGHIAWDIGAAQVTRHLAELLDTAAVLSAISRLVIDCNRPLDDPSSIPAVSDGVQVPGNRNLGAADRRHRQRAYFEPYHGEIRRRLDGFVARGLAPLLISIHSFTPVMDGFERPWHVGLLWDREPGLSAPVIAELRRDPGLVVGENQPYSGRDPRGYAIDAYANRLGLPTLLFEIRQDLIDSGEGALSWARRLHAVISPLLAGGPREPQPWP